MCECENVFSLSFKYQFPYPELGQEVDKSWLFELSACSVSCVKVLLGKTRNHKSPQS